MEIVRLRQEVAQGHCWCQEEDGDCLTSEPQSIYGNEEGCEVFGSEYLVGAVGSGSNSTGEAPQVDEGNVVPREVWVEEVVEGTSESAEPKIDGEEAMLALVEQEMLKIGWGIHRHSPMPEEEYTDSEIGERITEAWFEE